MKACLIKVHSMVEPKTKLGSLDFKFSAIKKRWKQDFGFLIWLTEIRSMVSAIVLFLSPNTVECYSTSNHLG